MATRTATSVVRADVVGSLLRPDYLGEARAAALAGTIDADELRAAEDRAVLEAIALQEGAGHRGDHGRRVPPARVDRADPASSTTRSFRAPVSRLRVPRRRFRLARPLEDGRGRAGRHLGAATAGALRDASRSRSTATSSRTSTRSSRRTRARARSTRSPRRAGTASTGIPSTRRDAYPTSDDFIADVARILREHVVDRLVELGCDYIQIDAPNYAQWHIDPDNRAAFEAHGHDMAHELVADAEFDSMVFEGVDRRHPRDAHVPRKRAGRHVGRHRRLRGDLERGLPAPHEPRPAAARVRLGPRRHLRVRSRTCCRATRSCSGS